MAEARKKKSTGAGGKIVSSRALDFRRGVTLYEQGKYAEAAQVYRAILAQQSKDISAWLNLGTALRKAGQYETALSTSRRAVELAPDNPGCLTNLGNIYSDLDMKEECLQAHATALRAAPEDPLVLNNYACALRDFGFCEEALVLFDRALARKPDNPDILWERATALLRLGNYIRGWDAFEIRWKQVGMQPRFYKSAPCWNGEDIRGKTVLVYEEQGFGDSILSSRYLPLIAAQGGRVVLECKKPLHRLFSRILGVVKIAEPGAVSAGFDYHVPMMGLPRIFKTDFGNIPRPAPLFMAPEIPKPIQELLDRGRGRVKIGIVWSGSVTFANNRRRAVSLKQFLPLAGIKGVELYSLQKGPCEDEIEACGAQHLVHNLGPHLNDFADTAAVIKKLDMIVMTDSSVAHLAGSLGVPVWNLLCTRSYWLYLQNRRETPWYPSMRLFRQDRPGDWNGVFETVAKELARVITRKNE